MTSLGCAVALLLLSVAAADEPGRRGLRVDGTSILTPDGEPIRLRGFNVLWWVPCTGEDADGIRALGANCVRYMLGYQPTGRFDPAALSFVVPQVREFTRRGLWVIPVVHDFRREDKGAWDSPELEREFLDMWSWVIEQLKDDPWVAAWEPINEPHDAPITAVRPWYGRVVSRIRSLDPARPIVVEGTDYSWPEGLSDELVLGVPNLVYSFHWYGPYEYTHQKPDARIPYPGTWDTEALAARIAKAAEFRDRRKVPVYCGEWGVQTYCPGYEQWLRDVAATLERYDLPWAHWAWANKPSDPESPSFDVNPHKAGIHAIMRDILRRARGTP